MPIKLPEPTPEEAAEGENALVEALAVDKGVNLEGGKALLTLRRLNREDAVDNHVSRIVVTAMYIVSICVAAIFISIVANKVLPKNLRFLDQDQLSDLYGFIVPLVTGFGAGVGRKYLAGPPKDGE